LRESYCPGAGDGTGAVIGGVCVTDVRSFTAVLKKLPEYGESKATMIRTTAKIAAGKPYPNPSSCLRACLLTRSFSKSAMKVSPLELAYQRLFHEEVAVGTIDSEFMVNKRQ
jgi:hypothetical protein